MRALLLQQAVQDGEAPTSSSSVRTLRHCSDIAVFPWTEEGSADMRASIRLRFAEPRIVSTCGNEADLGKPRKKHLIVLQSLPEGRIKASCTPQVTGRFEKKKNFSRDCTHMLLSDSVTQCVCMSDSVTLFFRYLQ